MTTLSVNVIVKGRAVIGRMLLLISLRNLGEGANIGLAGCWRYTVFPHQAVQLIPYVFNRVKDRTGVHAGHPVDPSLLHLRVHDPCLVRSYVVILIHCLQSHLT